jgi:hypothetical protein
MPQVKCNQCSTEFYAKPSWLKNGWGKYCSQNCSHAQQKNGKTFKCYICDKNIYRSIKSQKSSKSGKFFCSKSCQSRWKNSEINIGQNHPNWKYGEATYRSRLLRSNKELVCNKCQTKDKRVLAVHHIDKNRKNNKLSNLMWLCHNCHYLVHHFDNEAKGFLVSIA